MIDIHSHILPGLDDGALDMQTSLAMLKKAEAAGVTDIILTPHYIKGSIYNADNLKKWQAFNELKSATDTKINLYLGNEIYVDRELDALLAGYTGEKSKLMYEVSTLNSTKYVLVEFPVQSEDKTVKETLFSLVRKGLVPVIAHPERYAYVQNNPAYVDEFLSMGCLLQGDYLSILGRYGKRAEKTLKKLLFSGKIFCLASDVHKATDEYRLSDARKKLLRIVRSEKAVSDLLENHPRQIITGK